MHLLRSNKSIGETADGNEARILDLKLGFGPRGWDSHYEDRLVGLEIDIQG